MTNSDNRKHSEETIKKMAYIGLCGIVQQILVSGKRIAFAGELKSIRTLVDPSNIDYDEDMALLAILSEPHVKIASELANYIRYEVLEPYALVNSLDDDEVSEDKRVLDLGWSLFWRFMFYRRNPRVRERYINFGKILFGSQRVLYELLKLMATGETRAKDKTYRTNYSAGRLKALTDGNEDRNALMMIGLIEYLKDCVIRQLAIPVKVNPSRKKA